MIKAMSIPQNIPLNRPLSRSSLVNVDGMSQNQMFMTAQSKASLQSGCSNTSLRKVQVIYRKRGVAMYTNSASKCPNRRYANWTDVPRFHSLGTRKSPTKPMPEHHLPPLLNIFFALLLSPSLLHYLFRSFICRARHERWLHPSNIPKFACQTYVHRMAFGRERIPEKKCKEMS